MNITCVLVQAWLCGNSERGIYGLFQDYLLPIPHSVSSVQLFGTVECSGVKQRKCIGLQTIARTYIHTVLRL
jgi:hypothetical protein